MITRPTESPTINFQTGKTGSLTPRSLKATLLNHLYGEAQVVARAAEGIPETEQPRSITTYDCFRTKIADHLGIPAEEVDEDSVFFIAAEMDAKIALLKKTCVTLDALQS